MHILMFNWKDHTHPLAGGAEIVTHQHAKQLIDLGHSVTLFTSCYKNSQSVEIVDGVTIIRRGNWITVYLHAFWNYLTQFRKQVDIVVDQIHGIPFFTPLYVKKPILAWIHEVAGDIWDFEWPLPIARLGRIIERHYFALYRNKHFLTDTRSTKTELMHFGISEKNISVISLTITPPDFQMQQKSKTPQLIYVGRLSAMKRVDWFLQAAAIIQKRIPSLTVLIAGTGKAEYTFKLRKLVDQLQLPHVIFLGKISEQKKYEFLSSSWLHIQPSVKEGFGLTVMEAAVAGTPTTAFNVSGLKDQIVKGKNGFIVKIQTPHALADSIGELVSNQKRLNQLSKSSRTWSRTFPTWHTQTKKLEVLFQRLIKNSR